MKQVTINNDALKKALKRIKDIVDKKSALPIIQNLIFKVKTTGVSLIATDLEVTTILEIPSSSIVLDEFEILLPFELLYKISSLSGSTPIEILADGNSATIKCDHDKYDLKSLEKISDFPKVPEIPDENNLSIADGFVDWINRSMTTVSADTLRPVMTKICIDIVGTSLSIVTTDANVMFKKTFVIEEQDDAQLIISAKVAKALSGFDQTQINWDADFLMFKADGLTVFAKRSTDKYVNYKAVLPENTTPNIEFDRVHLINSLEKVALAAGSTMLANLQLKSMIGGIKILSSDESLNISSSVDLPADYSGDCEAIGLNIDKFLKLLNQVPFSNICLSIMAPNKPVILSSPEDEKYLSLIMPMIIS